MLKHLRILSVLGFFIGSPALADIITNVTVNGSVSGTGHMTEVCYFVGEPPPGCYQVVPGRFIRDLYANFSATNTQLGSFSDSSHAGIDVFNQLTIGASQSTTATSDSLSLDLFSNFAWIGRGPEVSIQNNNVVGFDLTTESLLQVSGYSEGDVQLLDSSGNPVFTCCSGSLILEPGMYEFTESLPLTANNLFACYESCGGFLASVLDAKFTPIPEPRGTGLTLLIAVGCLAFRRRAIAG